MRSRSARLGRCPCDRRETGAAGCGTAFQREQGMSFLDRFRVRGLVAAGASPDAGGTILSPPGDEETGGRRLTSAERALGDFTISLRSVWPVVALSVVVGAISAGVALVLLDLIGLITHIAYDGTFGWSLIQPTLRHFGWLTLFVPVIGGLIIGDGLLGVGAHPRPRDPRGHGDDPGRRKQDRAAAGHPEADIQRGQHRYRRSLRRRGPDHPDRRRVRLRDRPVLPAVGQPA